MKQNYGGKTPGSFTETVQLVEEYVRAEVVKETKTKQLYYHTLDHAEAVKSRANNIFQAIKPVLLQSYSEPELTRLEDLTNLCGLAHDMVQLFDPSTAPDKPRRRPAKMSEAATAEKLLSYIQNLNHQLSSKVSDPKVLFEDRDRQIIQDAIDATVCLPDPQADRPDFKFSANSIYQPYLYNSQPKVSLVGHIIALADLGTLGMEGIDRFVKDGILIFLEDNLEFEELVLHCNIHKYLTSDSPENNDVLTQKNRASGRPSQRNIATQKISQKQRDQINAKLLGMTRFMLNLAHDRYARFETEIAHFSPAARQILRDHVFVYLNQENIKNVEQIIPTHKNVELLELMNFFCLDSNI